MSSIPEKPTLDGLEAKWRAVWEEQGTYRFDRSRTRDEVYSIDTPPPTVSGALHIGHVMSFTHTDTVARYQRMRGKEVFYPMGWDDNGLNVERRVQMLTATLCDPSLAYDPDFSPPQPDDKGKLPKDPVRISRPNFVELCESVVEEMEEEYQDLWQTVGLSVDWTQTYTTIGPLATRISQKGFLRLLEQGTAYRSGAPTLWDVDMKTAVAQAELEDRDIPGAYHKLLFTGPDGSDLAIDTTRPELLPACVALVAHPDDERYQSLFGKTAVTPLFGAEVPICAHQLAQPDKGTGMAMICTFGDTTDVIWWRELDLPIRPVVRHDGRLERDITWVSRGSGGSWESTDAAAANAHYAELGGKTIFTAQKNIVELLTSTGNMEGEPRPITHPVKYWENGKKPLEIVTSNQWFIRYPPAAEIIERAKDLEFHPEYMRVRFEDWANGLQGDWNITRQRFFGVPFPIWYPVDEHGDVDYLAPIPATEDMLPVDPTTTPAPGFDESRRNQPGGFAADPDVMDTWNTSSMSPQITSRWEEDPDLFARVYPMDLRPQAHDIIRTWLFATVVKAHEMFGHLPFRHAAISGFVVDPDRKKLSKSKDNAEVGPFQLLEMFGADAIRYWACGGGPGRDVANDQGQMKIGRRLAIKLLNASRFVLTVAGPDEAGQPWDHSEPSDGASVTEPLDRAMLLSLADLVEECTRVFDDYDYARALERVETFFWTFTDDYLELVKGRAYGSQGDDAADSAKVALRLALETLLKLFAPFLPYATEEVWSWWREGSIHRSPWPSADPLRQAAGGADPDAMLAVSVAGEVLSLLRRAKSDAKVSMRTEITDATVHDTPERLAAFDRVRADVADAGRVISIDTKEAGELLVDVELAPAD
ncbi:MAG: valine--tRNA ligase [Acidimicrobiales bacterium]